MPTASLLPEGARKLAGGESEAWRAKTTGTAEAAIVFIRCALEGREK